MPSNDQERGFIVFDKSPRSVEALASLLMRYPEPTNYVSDWLRSDNEILLWILAVAPESCRVITLKSADDLLGGALEEFADDLGEAVFRTRIATGPLNPVFAQKVRQRWKLIGGIVSGI